MNDENDPISLEEIGKRLKAAQTKLAVKIAAKDQDWAALADPKTGAIFMLADLVHHNEIKTPADHGLAMMCVRMVYGELLAAETQKVLDEGIKSIESECAD